MKRTSPRLAVAGLSVAAISLAGALPASAAPDQYAPSIPGASVVGTPLSGPTNLPARIVTSVPCPAGTTVVNGYINNTAAGWTDVQAISINENEVPVMTTAGIPLDNSYEGVAAAALPSPKTLVNGTYELAIVCFPDAFSAATAQIDGTFTITGAAANGTGGTYTYTAAPPPASPTSTTTLAVAPAGGANLGDSVTLTATVASTGPIAGSVTFKDGATTLGTSPVAGGVAAFSTTALPGGVRSLTAEFTPTSAIQASTSAAVSYTITAPAQATTTTLSSTPAAPTTIDVVALTATVSPATATGTVTFKEGATTVGTATVSGGTASVSLASLTAGTKTYTADFVPNNASYLASTAAAYSFTVTTYAGAAASENITTTVNAGTLTITAGGPTVDLGPAALNATNDLLVTAPKDINDVTITDTRAGNLGYSVSGVVGDFVSGSNLINSENLGWTPKVVNAGGTNITAAAATAPGAGVAVGATTGAGLKTVKPLASSAPGDSVGTAIVSATLRLQAPTSTLAGVYNTTLTLTAI